MPSRVVPNATSCWRRMPRCVRARGEAFSLEQIVGDSPKVRERRQLIRTVAATDARVLVLGESGTGKELVAGSLHALSKRRNENYVPHQTAPRFPNNCWKANCSATKKVRSPAR